jgi:phage I-like protein
MTDQLATPSDLGGIAPALVQLLPAGTFSGRDGRGPYRLDVQSVLSEFSKWGMPLAIDFEHQAIHAPENGNPAPAAGWISQLESKPDGIWGRVEWTAKSTAMITAKEYRYLSPVFDHTNDGTVARLTGAGLTNNPNLYLTAISRRGAVLFGQKPYSTEPAPIPFNFLLFNAANRSGLIPKKEKEQARQLCAHDPQGFAAYIRACNQYQYRSGKGRP